MTRDPSFHLCSIRYIGRKCSICLASMCRAPRFSWRHVVYTANHRLSMFDVRSLVFLRMASPSSLGGVFSTAATGEPKTLCFCVYHGLQTRVPVRALPRSRGESAWFWCGQQVLQMLAIQKSRRARCFVFYYSVMGQR